MARAAESTGWLWHCLVEHQEPKGHPGFNSAQCLEDRGRVGGKLTRSEAEKPQHNMPNSWKSGLKTRYYFLILFFVRVEKKTTKPGPVSAKG